MQIAESKNRNVAFRRIGGRIVPIRIKTQQISDASAGAALVGAGIGVGVGSGKLYRTINSASTRLGALGTRALSLLDKTRATAKNPAQLTFDSMTRATRIEKSAGKLLSRGAKIGKFSAPARLGGQFAASTLIGLGATKIAQAFNKKQLSNEQASAIGGSAALGAFLAGGYGKAGIRTYVRPFYVNAYPHVRKLKGLLKL